MLEYFDQIFLISSSVAVSSYPIYKNYGLFDGSLLNTQFCGNNCIHPLQSKYNLTSIRGILAIDLKFPLHLNIYFYRSW